MAVMPHVYSRNGSVKPVATVVSFIAWAGQEKSLVALQTVAVRNSCGSPDVCRESAGDALSLFPA
jgi:hypothetical protein